MNLKSIATVAAVSLTMCAAQNAFALSEDFYSKDQAVISSMVTQTDNRDIEDFIDDNLDTKMRHLSRLVTISSNMAYDKIPDEVEVSLKDGVTATEIKEAIYHSAAYCGYTRAAGALDIADKTLSELGEDITYKSRITSDEESRYQDGLSVQRTLFGPAIGTVTDDMPPASKLQTIYLSGICFGDFYNRTGLSLYTREFLTFCTIVGNGNCQGQLMGHANGNYSVGHSPDMLRAAVLLNADINGTEKTALALSVINTTDNGEEVNAPKEPDGKTQTITTSYKSDSEELLATMSHYKADDADGFIDKQIGKETQDLIIDAIGAVIEGKDVPASEDKAKQLLLELAVIAAEGGRESEVPQNVADSIAAGNSGDTMLATALLCTPYNGFPRTLNIMSAINQALADISKASAKKPVIKMQIGSPEMTVDGEKKSIDEEGTSPIIKNDRTILPVRAVIEALGGTVLWDDNTKTVTLGFGSDEVRLVIDSNIAYLNGEQKEIDCAPEIINERTMLPIRFIAESFGLTVIWSEETKTVTIIDAEKIENVFEKGMLNPAAPKFTGVSYLNFLTQYDEEMKIPPFGLVTFEPCTRTDWHSHDGGQILLVTEGTGVFGMEGKEPRVMQSGDVILIPPGVRHFHSAIDDSEFAHIALGVNPGVGTTNWYEKVSEEEYNAAVAAVRAKGIIPKTGRTMFPLGEKVAEDGYTGTVYKNLLVEYDDVFHCPNVYNFTFESGAKTDWHSHAGGQLIVVTNGTGVYQEEGSELQTVSAGDIIIAKPGVKHWHGATDDTFAYISVGGNPGNDSVTWENK